MSINIVGTGKMGQSLAQSLDKNQLGQIFDSTNLFGVSKVSEFDIIVDCSLGPVFLQNLSKYLQAKQKIVVVASGWYQQMAQVKAQVKNYGGALIWADNYSISMLVYKQILKLACRSLSQDPTCDIYGLEAHHTHKKDAPSGTTKQIAKLILENFPAKTEVLYDLPKGQINSNQLHIASLRGGLDNIWHDFFFDLEFEQIELKHTVKNRLAFVSGILQAVNFIQTQESGFFGLEDLFSGNVGLTKSNTF